MPSPAGTLRVKGHRLPGPSGSLAVSPSVNGTLFFTATARTYGAELWKSDGTGAGTVLVLNNFTAIWQDYWAFLVPSKSLAPSLT